MKCGVRSVGLVGSGTKKEENIYPDRSSGRQRTERAGRMIDGSMHWACAEEGTGGGGEEDGMFYTGQPLGILHTITQKGRGIGEIITRQDPILPDARKCGTPNAPSGGASSPQSPAAAVLAGLWRSQSPPRPRRGSQSPRITCSSPSRGNLLPSFVPLLSHISFVPHPFLLALVSSSSLSWPEYAALARVTIPIVCICCMIGLDSCQRRRYRSISKAFYRFAPTCYARPSPDRSQGCVRIVSLILVRPIIFGK
ncbi:hypothetical protein DENSPDRAFT_214896 [Dentipellis sp. KUC8613]|nr:hypothetical protein DENSPDRAFT_214896 [Dentipellis sp. KUC8613]